MDSERTSLIVIGVLAIAFVIGIADRLQQPLPVMGGSTTGGMIASIIGGLMCLALFAGTVFAQDAERSQRLRSLLIWGVIVTAVVLGITLFSGGGTRVE